MNKQLHSHTGEQYADVKKKENFYDLIDKNFQDIL